MKFFKKKRRSKVNIYANRPVLYTNRKSKNSSGIKNIAKTNLGKFKKIILILTTIIATGFGLYLILFSNQFLVKDINVIVDEIQNEENPIKHYFNQIKGQNIILAKTDEIKNRILEDHPEIEQLEIKKRLPSTLQIEYSEFAIVANVLQTLEEGQKKYLINSQGRVAKKDTENPNLPYIKITNEEDFKGKTELIDPKKLEYILGSIKYFEEKFGMKVFDVAYLKEAREVHLRTEKYFFVWLDTTQNYETQFVKLKKTLTKLDIYNEPLEYIDLRIAGSSGEKVIYKLK